MTGLWVVFVAGAVVCVSWHLLTTPLYDSETVERLAGMGALSLEPTDGGWLVTFPDGDRLVVDEARLDAVLLGWRDVASVEVSA